MMHDVNDGQDETTRHAREDSEFASAVENLERHHRELMEALKDDGVSLEEFEGIAERLCLEADALKHVRLGLSDQREGMRRTGPGTEAGDIAA